jgi:uncharacterized protein YjiS (DUF1127 family)
MERALPHCRPAQAQTRWYSWILRAIRQRGLARQRRQLARLEPHLLRDIGLTAHEAQTEAQRPRWDAPAHWIRRDIP